MVKKIHAEKLQNHITFFLTKTKKKVMSHSVDGECRSVKTTENQKCVAVC